MFSFALAAGWLCATAWLYLLLAHGRFWRIPLSSRDLIPSRAAPDAVGGVAKALSPVVNVAVVIPARNEAATVGRAVTSLLRQTEGARSVPAVCAPASGPGFREVQLHIFVVDDNSSDGTADAARAVGSLAMAARRRVTVIAGRPLPPGWSGKVWVMQQGIEQALQLSPDFLLLTDADIEHAPESLATLIAIAEAGGYDLVSFMVKLHCRSVAERLLIPAFVFFFFMLYPPEWVRDVRQKTAAAAGGCMLLRPAALERIGGIAAIRQEIIDDCALARAVKRSGGKVWLGLERVGGERTGTGALGTESLGAECVVSGHDFSRAEQVPPLNPSGLQPATETHSLRPYGSFAEIERMIARTAFSQLHHSFWLLLGTVVGMLLLYVLPLVLIVTGSPRLAFAGAFSYGVMTFAYLPMVRFYRLSPLWSLTLPVAGMFYTAATIHSAVKYWTGRGGEWKGRAQDIR